jgi:hypothetical protein
LEENRKKNNRNQQLLLFGLFAAILLFSLGVVINQQTGKKNKNNMDAINSSEMESEINSEGDKPLLAVIVQIDLMTETITLQDISNGQEITVTYSGGTNILDQYQQPLTVSQLTLGEVVEAYTTNDKLVKLQISNQVWEYSGINKWSVNTGDNTITIADTMYKYNNNLVVSGDNEIINLFDLNEKDQLTIKGKEKDIYSVIVTKGHGAIRFEEYEDFIGGTAYIGNREILPVEAGMIITVRQGTHEIILEKDNFIGYKTVEVKRDETVIVNMGEFKRPPEQKGLVKFDIIPYGADLYIDDELMDYDAPIQLDYGEHTIRAELGGYTTYSGNMVLNDTSKSLTIDLAESTLTDNTDGSSENILNSESGSETETVNGTSDGNKDGNTEGTTDDSTEGTTDSNADGTMETEQSDADYIYVQSPEGVSVYFNAEYKGTAPVKFPKVTGTHYIILIKSGYETQTHTVEIKDDGKDVYYNFQDMVME